MNYSLWKFYSHSYSRNYPDNKCALFFPLLFRLCEPKKDLIARVVKIIGKRKAIELLMETAEVEQNGGLFIVVRKMSSFCGFARDRESDTAFYFYNISHSAVASLSCWTCSPGVLWLFLAMRLP